MELKRHFVYQIDYQHWANQELFGALDRLDEEARKSTQPLFFGSVHNNLDHLAYFYHKWFVRLRGDAWLPAYSGTLCPDWPVLKSRMQLEIRELQRWLAMQPDSFFDGPLNYMRSAGDEGKILWVRDALTHLLVYSSLERGRVSSIGSLLGAPLPEMHYHIYRREMGEHLEHLRQAESGRGE